MDAQQGSARGAVVHVRGEVATTGSARSTAQISFGGEVVTWEHLPAQTRRLARRRAALVAEAVQREGSQWAPGGRAVETATGWRVHEDAVVLAAVLRPVAPAPAGGMRPVGPWEHRSVRVLEASAPARRRRGVVDVADELDQGVAAGTAPAPVRHSQAAEAWSYLPHVVRAAAERLVPAPWIWLGQMVQRHTADGFPAGQDVRSLRMSADRAVVVMASRELTPIPGAGMEVHVSQMARVPWVVEQVGLDLGPGRAPLQRLTRT